MPKLFRSILLLALLLLCSCQKTESALPGLPSQPGTDSAVAASGSSAEPQPTALPGSTRLNLTVGTDSAIHVRWLVDNQLLVEPRESTSLCDFEIYDMNLGVSSPVKLEKSDEYGYNFVAAFGHFVLYESDKRWTGDSDYVVDYAWIYDADTKSAKRYPINEYIKKPKKGKILCCGTSNHVFYMDMESGIINSVYYLPDGGYQAQTSPDKSKIVFADEKGVHVSDTLFNNSKLLIKARPENIENPTFSQGIGNVFWVNNTTIGYSWYVEIDSIECGFINSDGTGEILPEALKEMELYPAPIQDSKVFAFDEYEGYHKIGLYDLSGKWFDLTSEIEDTFCRSVFRSPNGQYMILYQENSISLLQLNKDLSKIEHQKDLPEQTNQIFFFDGSFSPDNTDLIYQIEAGSNRGIYVMSVQDLMG